MLPDWKLWWIHGSFWERRPSLALSCTLVTAGPARLGYQRFPLEGLAGLSELLGNL